MSTTQLPPPAENQAYFDVSALEGGEMQLRCSFFVTTAKKDEVVPGPALSFLLQHSKTKEKLLFDLGIRKDVENAIPPVRDRFVHVFHAKIPNDVKDNLARGGIELDDIKHVILSHVHWDHHGNPDLFKRSRFLVGAETKGVLEKGYPRDKSSTIPADLLPEDRTDFIPVTDEWKPVGPFPRALDYFKDGSLYLVDAPGHMPGHINALVRTSPDGGWLLLAGDSAHDWRLIRGEGEIAVVHDETHGTVCFHQDLEKAKEHQKHIAEYLTLPRTQCIIAHDAEWFAKNKGGPAYFPGKIPSL